MTDPEFPGPEATDPEDVVWALQTAGTMFARGDVREAVRWLRRGAEAAGESGNDLRALALARRAADLAATHQVQGSVPPPADADQTTRMKAAGRPAIVPADDAEGGESDLTIPEGLSAVHRSSPFAAPPPVRSSPAAAPPPLRRSSPAAAPPPPSARASAAPPPPSARASGTPPPPPASATPAPSAPAAARGPTPSRPAPQPSQPPAATRSSPRASPSVAPAGPRPRHAWRVAVEPATDDSGRLWVKPLAEDEAVPDGMHEALLTALEAGAHLLSKKR